MALFVLFHPGAALGGESREASAPRTWFERAGGFSSGGPYGGRVLSLAADPNDSSVLYAGTEVGLFRSEDAGASWAVLTLGRDFLSPLSPFFGDRVEAVVVNPARSSEVFASLATLERFGIFPNAVGLLSRSEDSGQSWTGVVEKVGLGLEFAIGAGRIYANTSRTTPSGTLAVSTDGGRTFTPLPLSYVGSIAVDPVALTTLFAVASPDGQTPSVYKSSDGGMTWAATNLVGAGVGALSLHVDPARHFTIYAERNGFYRSEDGGSHWTPNRWALDTPIAAFAIGPGSRVYAATSSGGVYESVDRGDTWSRVGSLEGGLLSLIDVEGSIFAGADGRGVFRSDDRGATWTARIEGLAAAAVGVVAVAPSAGDVAYALSAGFARTSDAGASWSVDPFAPTALTGALAVDPTDPEIVYASGAVAGVLRSADGGSTWTPTFPTSGFVTSIAISPETPTTLYMADGQPWRSTDSGETWSLVSDGIPNGADLIVADPTATGALYASNGDLYRSEDGGDGWAFVHTSPDLYGSPITEVIPDPAHPGTVYVVAGSFWKSTDRGASWTWVEPPSSTIAVSAVVVDSRGIISAGALNAFPHSPLLPSGAFRSVDGGATWRPIAPWGVRFGPIGFVTSLAVSAEGDRLYAGTSGNGVWQIGFRATHALPTR